MDLIDAHAHLSFFTSETLKSMFSRAEAVRIRGWIMAGYDLRDWQIQKSLVLAHPNLRASFGLHPWKVIEFDDAEIDRQMGELETLLPLAAACGETGIDGVRGSSQDQLLKQEAVLNRHLELNKTLNLPLILHVVKSHDAALSHLRQHPYRGIVHGFSGSWETAKRYIALGYKISIGRGVYEKGYRHLKETALKIGETDYVIESDAGLDDQGRAEDAVEILSHVAQALAQIRGESVEKVGRASAENVKNIFGPL